MIINFLVFIFVCFVMVAMEVTPNVFQVGIWKNPNLSTQYPLPQNFNKKKSRRTYPLFKRLSRQLQANNFLRMAQLLILAPIL